MPRAKKNPEVNTPLDELEEPAPILPTEGECKYYSEDGYHFTLDIDGDIFRVRKY